jgi:hypothetical protein
MFLKPEGGKNDGTICSSLQWVRTIQGGTPSHPYPTLVGSVQDGVEGRPVIHVVVGGRVGESSRLLTHEVVASIV